MVGISRHNCWHDPTPVPQLAAQAYIVEHRSTVGVASLCYLGWFLDGFARFHVDWDLRGSAPGESATAHFALFELLSVDLDIRGNS